MGRQGIADLVTTAGVSLTHVARPGRVSGHGVILHLYNRTSCISERKDEVVPGEKAGLSGAASAGGAGATSCAR